MQPMIQPPDMDDRNRDWAEARESSGWRWTILLVFTIVAIAIVVLLFVGGTPESPGPEAPTTVPTTLPATGG